jgi:hypothetical protein
MERLLKKFGNPPPGAKKQSSIPNSTLQVKRGCFYQKHPLTLKIIQVGLKGLKNYRSKSPYRNLHTMEPHEHVLLMPKFSFDPRILKVGFGINII